MNLIPTLPAALLTGSAAICIVGFSAYSTVSGLHNARISVSLVPTSAEVADALNRSGLDPTALAAAGVSSTQVNEVVTEVRAWLASNPAALSSADASIRSARMQRDPLQRLIASGCSAPDDRNAYATAIVNLAQAESDLADTLDAIFIAGTGGLSQSSVNTLNVIRSNTPTWENLPVEFLVVSDRTEAQWVSLREALANERICAALGEQMDSDCQTFLANARADGAVSAADASLDSNLTAITTEWTSSVGG